MPEKPVAYPVVAPDIRTAIVEDDPFARAMMAMLLMRDWRTDVVGDVYDKTSLRRLLRSKKQVDVLLLDVERPDEKEWAFNLAALARDIRPTIKIVCTCIKPDDATAKKIFKYDLNGYVCKQEISYAIAWAAVLAVQGKMVATPATGRRLLRNAAIEAGSVAIVNENNMRRFTPRQREIARLAVLFNMRGAEIADELYLSNDTVRRHTANVYKRLHLKQILQNEQQLPTVFHDQARILRQFEIARSQFDKSLQSAGGKATLAFHLLTAPTITFGNQPSAWSSEV